MPARKRGAGRSVLTGNLTAADLLAGKTGYADDPDTKVTGSLVVLDTSDATMASLDIKEGKTGYVNGVKITGLRKKIYFGESDYNTVRTVENDGLAIGKDVSMSNPAKGCGMPDWVMLSSSGGVTKANKDNLATIGNGGADFNNSTASIIQDGANIYSLGDQVLDKRHISTCANIAYYAVNGRRMVNLGLHIFLTTGQVIRKILKSNMTLAQESAAYGGNMMDVATDGTNIFGAGATIKKVFKYAAADLAKLAESADYGGNINCICADATHVYCAGATTKKVFKLLASDLTKVAESADYGGEIKDMAMDAEFIYYGGSTTNRIVMIRKSDMSQVAISAVVAPITTIFF